jgi:hypothetical protein
MYILIKFVVVSLNTFNKYLSKLSEFLFFKYFSWAIMVVFIFCPSIKRIVCLFPSIEFSL